MYVSMAINHFRPQERVSKKWLPNHNRLEYGRSLLPHLDSCWLSIPRLPGHTYAAVAVCLLYDHKSGPNWQKNVHNYPNNVTFRSVRGPDRCYIGNQPQGDFQITKWLPNHKSSLNWPKNVQKLSLKIHVPLCLGTRQMLQRQSATLFSRNGHE